MKDVFTVNGTLISPEVRELQLEFHDLRKKKADVVAALAPAREEYKVLRRKGFTHCPEMVPLKDKILAANEVLGDLDSRMGALTRAVEALNVLAQSGKNFRPGVATMGNPK